MHLRLVQRIARRFRRSSWDLWPDAVYEKACYRERLEFVQRHLRAALERTAKSPIRILSICAGDGRDVIGMLQSFERNSDVRATLIEQNRRTIARGERLATNSGLQHRVAFRQGDATSWATYSDLQPADIILLCGVWGHVPAADRPNLVDALACLCSSEGCIVWTRGISFGMQRLEQIQLHFAAPRWKLGQLSFTPRGDWAIVTTYCHTRIHSWPTAGQIFRFRRGAGTVDETTPSASR